MACLRRLKKELKALDDAPLPFCTLTPKDPETPTEITAQLEGAAGSPYEGGTWTIELKFAAEYPFKAPNVLFKTKIMHPNVKTDTGEICPDVLFGTWSPTLNIKHIFVTLQELMQKPIVDTPLEADLAMMYTQDKAKYEKTVRDHVKSLKK
mmetsp:Transcript_8290/g.25927  ORF Transcript_8290/g.25927 Transcript_8290/m.25927 type:complete len:151 (-) Transcript_8290:55-507(-)